MLIREATPDDWPALHPIFAAIVAAGRTYAYPDDLTSGQARALWLEPPPGRAIVALEDASADARILGTAKMGPNRPGRGDHVATASFMIDPETTGRGVGRALAEEMVAWARSSGYRGVQFNAVVETNEAAVRLWRALGFVTVGTVPGAFRHPEHGYVGLHLMYLDLT